MSRILLCGMTSAQCNPRSHVRSTNFAGLLKTALNEAGHDVFWEDPQVWWTENELEDYNAVIVGLAPITSLGANRAYGALNVINLLWKPWERLHSKKSKLYFYLDAPEPARVWAGLRATDAHPENFTKSFYSPRKGYEQALEPETRTRLLSTARTLLKGKWPVTIWPMLPWHNESTRLVGQLPPSALQSTRGINFDWHVHDPAAYVEGTRHDRWAVERGHEGWLKKMNLSWPTVDLTEAMKESGDDGVFHTLVHSAGTLVPPYRDGTWWTPRIRQSLYCQTPVVTEWRESQLIGGSWSTLATTLEGMDFDEQIELADVQAMAYSAWLRKYTPNTNDLNKLFRLRSWE